MLKKERRKVFGKNLKMGGLSMNHKNIDRKTLTESLKQKIEEREYELFELFTKDLDELESNDRYREFIFVTHNYISEIIDNIILNYFVSLEKRKEFDNSFEISRLGFSKKLDIIKKTDLVPKELCRVLSDFNKIRNIVAHHVDWLKKLENLDGLIIKKDKEHLYSSVSTWFLFLTLYLEFSKRSKKERKEMDKDFEDLAKELGMNMEEMFSFRTVK